MNTKKSIGSFPGFAHHIAEVQKYIRAGDTFTLMLKNGTIVHFITKEEVVFEKWLKDHQIIDIKR